MNDQEEREKFRAKVRRLIDAEIIRRQRLFCEQYGADKALLETIKSAVKQEAVQ